MISNQEKTLDSMLGAQESLRKHLQAAHTVLDDDCDTASIRTSGTSMTNLTAFDFDAAIKSTVVYQRCMERRSDRTGPLSLRLPTVQPDASPESKNMMTEKKQYSASELAYIRKIVQDLSMKQRRDGLINPYIDSDSGSDPSSHIDLPRSRCMMPPRRSSPPSDTTVASRTGRLKTPVKKRFINPYIDSDSDSDSSYYNTHGHVAGYDPFPRLPFRSSDTVVASEHKGSNTPRTDLSPGAHRHNEDNNAMEVSTYHHPALPADAFATDATVRDATESLAARDFQLFQSRILSFSKAIEKWTEDLWFDVSQPGLLIHPLYVM